MNRRLLQRQRDFFNAISAVMAMLCVTTALAGLPAQAQTFTVLHNFSGGADGKYPQTTLTLDRRGNLYGTTNRGGLDYGTIFRLTNRGSGWLFNTLYTFRAGSDGSDPFTPLLFGPDGALYGTTQGGGQNGDGTVFVARPQATFCANVSCPWTETVLYSFTGGEDSFAPQGHLIFDEAGNLYGTTAGFSIAGKRPPQGGYQGAVWELVHANGAWTIKVLYGFYPDGGPYEPEGGVTFDHAGNLYGTTVFGGEYNDGTVFELSPSGSGWTEQLVHTFDSSSIFPQAGLIADEAGNMYGATFGGSYAFELSPLGNGWSFNNISLISTGDGPFSDLTLDSQGNLYGANYTGGQYGQGNIFKLTNSGGVWTLTDLYDFTGGSDGDAPVGGVVLDANGNIYGTASEGGTSGWGTVWKLTP